MIRAHLAKVGRVGGLKGGPNTPSQFTSEGGRKAVQKRWSEARKRAAEAVQRARDFATQHGGGK